MKEEKLLDYIFLWAILECGILLLGVFRNIFIRKKEKRQLIYIEQLLYAWGMGGKPDNILAEIFYNLRPGSSIAKIISKAKRFMKGTKEPMVELERSFSYIEKRLGSFPVTIFHQVYLALDKPVCKEVLGLCHEIKNLWLKELKELRAGQRSEVIKGLAMIIFMMSLNFGIYMKWQVHISYQIFMVVNIIGLLVFAVLVLGKSSQGVEFNAGKLAFLEWQLEIILLSADNSVIEAICQSYDYAPQVLKPRLKELIENIKINSMSVKPYNDMCHGSSYAEMYECMGALYEERYNTGKSAIDRQTASVRNYIRSLYKDSCSASEQKIKATTGAALRMYQCAGSVGLMINIVTILLRFAGQAA